MAALTQTSKAGPGARSATPNTLSASDTMVYTPGTGQEIVLHNTTAGSLTVTITGSAATTVFPQGGGSINYASGLAVTVAAGAAYVINCDAIANYLQGTITLTGASGLKAFIWSAV